MVVEKIGRVQSELFERDVYSCHGEAERCSMYMAGFTKLFSIEKRDRTREETRE